MKVVTPMIKRVVKNVIRPKWVAFRYDADAESVDDYELGISIFGVVVGLYKADTIYPDNPIGIRQPGKREFGESLYPLDK